MAVEPSPEAKVPGPVVDVIVATNRHSPYLEEALASVQAQTWPGWRLVVVDDGSPVPEEIREICDRIPGSRYLRQEAAGVSAARNAGLRAGTGGLVAFLDDDDVWHPERLARQVAAWEASGRCAGVYSRGWYLDPAGVRLGHLPAEAATREEFLSGKINIPWIGSMLVRRDVAERLGGFDEGLRFAEDDHFILRVLRVGELSLVPDELAGYRRHPGNVTNASPTVRHRSSERFLRALIRLSRTEGDAAETGLLRANLRRYRSRAATGWTGRMVQAVHAGDRQAIVHDTWWSWTRAPWAALGGLADRVRRRAAPRRSESTA